MLFVLLFTYLVRKGKIKKPVLIVRTYRKKFRKLIFRPDVVLPCLILFGY